jgi:orotidine-5'-phosphate decarboxylase
MNIPRIFVALDFANAADALALTYRLDPMQCGLKVGKELFVNAGPEPVRKMIDAGFAVFLDLKFHDIPNTVASACAAATRLGVAMLNVHASGGRAMLSAAREGVDRTATERAPLLVAVTVLTSLSDADVREIGFARDAAALTLDLAALTQACKLDGVVCSAHDARALRKATGPDFKLVTPGIRLAESATDDQARIATPESAVRDGADYLVIGRPITQARDPVATLAAINASIARAAA